MDPLNDDELKHALRQWKAPDAPASLERRVLGHEPPQEPWWRWLLSGSVRIPVPALLGVVTLIVVLYAARGRETADAPAKPTVSLSDFQPVEAVEVKIVRRSE